jgi:hypothetical protein
MPVDLTTHANPVQKALILRDRLTVALSALWALTLTLEKLHVPHAFPDNITTAKTPYIRRNASTATHQHILPMAIRHARNVRLEHTQVTEQRLVRYVMLRKDI